MTEAPRRDIILLFSTRIIRLFCYGSLSVVLALYLVEAGLTEGQIGLLLTLTLIGDAVITLGLTTSADRLGRKRTLILGALLMAGAGIAFVLTRNYGLLIIAAIIGVISPSGNEIGPFLSVEQAGLTQLISNKSRTQFFAWYALAGSLATATGSLAGGWLAQWLQNTGWTALQSYRVVLIGYAVGGFLLLLLFLNVSKAIEVETTKDETKRVLGLHRSRAVVFKLSSLFAMDAFAGALLVQSLIAYWFHVRFGVESGALGSIFFGANIFAGISALLAIRLAKRFRADQHHGFHPHSVESFADSGPPDANSAVGRRRFAFALQHIANGCPHASILYNGCGGTRRAIRGCWRDCHRTFAGCLCFSSTHRVAFQHTPVIQCPVLLSRRAEDYL